MELCLELRKKNKTASFYCICFLCVTHQQNERSFSIFSFLGVAAQGFVNFSNQLQLGGEPAFRALGG